MNKEYNKGKENVYKYILVTIIIGIVVYIFLNFVWYISSKNYRPSFIFWDSSKPQEDLNHIWDKLRKGHTK